MSWVYILSESSPEYRLYTVGFYDPDGKWHPESDHEDSEDAARRCAWLNGECERCQGDGRDIHFTDEPCVACNGTGKQKEN